MVKVEIYISPHCGFCHAAKRLLNSKGVTFEEFDVMLKPSLKKEMIERAEGRRTVPQIFIGGHGIGGCDELYALDTLGELEPMLGTGN